VPLLRVTRVEHEQLYEYLTIAAQHMRELGDEQIQNQSYARYFHDYADKCSQLRDKLKEAN
jgi:hypothetical protein